MALSMNRYIGNSILPLLISHSKFYNEADNYANLLDATLHTVYRLSKNRMLTKGQREAVSDFLVALTRFVGFYIAMFLLVFNYLCLILDLF